MKSARIVISALGIAASAIGIGCGGGSDITCGAGTVEVDGVCTADPTECGTGTTLVSGECVPDGTVICEQGTVFDPTSGRCVVDPSACAAGTVLVAGECVPEDDTLGSLADFQEMAEPNGPGEAGVAGMFDAPALDASTTFYGCVTATTDADGDGNLDADLDTWLVTANAPMVLEITADGIRGLSAGFVAVNADAALSPILDNWQRFGLNLTSDTAQRQIFLPAAGVYALFLTDSRSLFLGQAGAGTPESCYFTTVTHVATPAGTPLTIPQQVAAHDGDVQVFTHSAAAEGDILDISQNSVAPAFLPAFVVLRGGALAASAASVAGPFGDTPPFTTQGGFASGEMVTIVSDAEFNYGLVPQAYVYDSFSIAGQAFPTTGTQIIVDENNGESGAGYPDLNYLYFDVGTAGVKHFDVTANKPIDIAIVRRDVFTPAGAFDYIASINAFGGTGQTTFQNEFVRFLTPGRYYFVTQNPAGVSGATYTVTSAITDVAAGTLTLGTGVMNQSLPQTSGFHTLDLTNPVWLEFGTTGTTNWGTATFSVEAYDNAAGGWLRSGTPPGSVPAGSVYPAFFGTQPAAAPFVPMGRILVGDARDFLLRIRPSGTAGANPTYGLLAQNRPNVTDLGIVSPGVQMSTVTALAPGAPARYVAIGAAGNQLRSLNHPVNATSDLAVRRLNANESVATTFNAGGVGADETLTGTFPAAPANWIAWQVENLTAATTTDVDVTLTTIAPTPYMMTTGTLAFNDACAGGGTTIATGADDQMYTGQTLPASFSGFLLFGEAPPATFRVGANGWISWDTGAVSFGAYLNQMMPATPAPNGMIAPFWQDQDTITLCRKDDAIANTVTYQWTGNVYITPAQLVQYQVVLHSNGVIDFIYGPNHVANGAFADTDGNGATVGLENLGGSFGHQYVYNQAGVAPSTSRTMTPM